LDVVRLPVITGCTATGKSALALAIADRHPVVIVSADSRQVYRSFDIGTAKPSAADQARTPHAAIDVAEPTERFNASRWAAVADAAIRDARAAGRAPLIVGGTGLYLKALFEPLFDEPALDLAARRALEADLSRLPTDELRQRVLQLDPARAHLGRAQLLRALEVAILTGTPISTWHREAARPARYAARYLVADAGEALSGRIIERLDQMLHGGWSDEVRRLMGTVPPEAPAWKATGYDAMRRMLAGEVDPDAARQEILARTRQFAKRQRTWFRHQLPPGATRLDASDMPRAVRDALGWWTMEALT
jgi:tRNA dimethylallyltransferase